MEDGDGADGESAVDSILAAHAVLEKEGFAGGDGLVPGVHRRLGVLGVDGQRPAVALVVGLGLAREAAPAQLRPPHFALRRVRPDDLGGRFDEAAVALLAPL